MAKTIWLVIDCRGYDRPEVRPFASEAEAQLVEMQKEQKNENDRRVWTVPLALTSDLLQEIRSTTPA